MLRKCKFENFFPLLTVPVPYTFFWETLAAEILPVWLHQHKLLGQVRREKSFSLVVIHEVIYFLCVWGLWPKFWFFTIHLYYMWSLCIQVTSKQCGFWCWNKTKMLWFCSLSIVSAHIAVINIFCGMFFPKFYWRDWHSCMMFLNMVNVSFLFGKSPAWT